MWDLLMKINHDKYSLSKHDSAKAEYAFISDFVSRNSDFISRN